MEINIGDIEIKPQLQPLAYALYRDWAAINEGLKSESGQVDLMEALGAVDTKFGLVIQALAGLEEAVALRGGATLGGLPVLEDGQVVIASKDDPEADGPDLITI